LETEVNGEAGGLINGTGNGRYCGEPPSKFNRVSEIAPRWNNRYKGCGVRKDVRPEPSVELSQSTIVDRGRGPLMPHG